MRLAVRQLSKAYGLVWAVRDVDLEFQPGECVALLGPNGAGKTTFLKLISALLDPTSGKIEVEGKELGLGSSPLRSAFGLLTPKEHLYENLTAKENLRLFVSLYGKKKGPREIERTLESVGLGLWGDEYAASLSSGMRCRLTIAKWLLLEPKILLLDEPYGVLDGGGVDLLEGYLTRLCREGGTVILATHHIPRILKLCSRALILNRGRIIFDELKQEPWESFHRAYAEFLPRGERWAS